MPMMDAVAIGRGRSALPSRSAELRVAELRRQALWLTAAAVAILPAVVPRGPANTGPVDLFVALSVAGCLAWAATSHDRWRFPYVVPVGLMLLGGALGALAGPVPDAGVVAIVQDLALVVWAWALVNIAASFGAVTTILRTWAYSSIAWVLLLFTALVTGMSSVAGQTASEGSRTSLTFGDPNVSANYYFVSLMLIWSLQRPRSRAARWAAYALLVAAILSTGSNSGIVSLVLGTAAAAILGVYRRFGAGAAISALVCLILAGSVGKATVSIAELQYRAHESRYAFLRDGFGRAPSSVQQRDTLLEESTALYATGGLLGQGPVSTKPRLEREMAPLVKEAHNDYFAALTERGVIGLLGLLLLVIGLGVRTVGLIRRRLDYSHAGVLARPNALVGAVVGTMAAMGVYELLHVRHVWALFALLAALHLLRREWERSAAL